MQQPSRPQKLLLWGAILAYCLIGVEIIIMISPFALYFYSVYGPILNFLSSSALLSWTTEFFLPHMVFMDDPLVQGLSYLQILMVLGLCMFLYAAIPLYYGRFTNKGVVQKSFYSKVRHPQYLFLAISGLGLLLYWPRFIILILYVNMLFVYFFLAKNEEWRMKQEVPGNYENYMATTSMFIPGEPGAKVFSLLFGWIQPKWLAFLALYVVAMGGALAVAYGIRVHTVNVLPVVEQQGYSLVSVFPRADEEVREIFRAVRMSENTTEFLWKHKNVNLVYIMPGDFFLTALVTDEDRRFSDDMLERFPEILEWHQHKFKGGLGKFFKIFYNYVSTLAAIETNYDVERLIFVSVGDSQGHSVNGKAKFGLGVKRTPALVVDLDSYTHEVMSVIETSGYNKWGQMPMPTF